MAKKKSIKDKMLLNFSLLGKITGSIEGIDKGDLHQDFMQLTKNENGAFDRYETTLINAKQSSTDMGKDNFLQYEFGANLRKSALTFYLRKIASLDPANRLSHTMLTRAQYYKFVEK